LHGRVRELEQRVFAERNRVLEEQDGFLRMLIEEHESARLALVQERDAALAQVEELTERAAARAGSRGDLEAWAQKLAAEREASLDTLRRLQQQRDAAQAALEAVRKERDAAKEELAAWMSRLGVS